MKCDVGVYKIGQRHYNNNVDKNGGVYEANLIKIKTAEAFGMSPDELDLNLRTIRLPEEIDLLIFIGGWPTEADFEAAEFLLEISRKSVFVLSEIDTLKCIDIINKCDIVLHQCPVKMDVLGDLKQCYNWVPELFYNPVESLPDKANILVFGGASDGRMDCFNRYFYKNGELRNNVLLLTKHDKDHDYRMDFESFQKILAACKYTSIIITDKARSAGWVTPRFVEAISNNTIPFVDLEYDRYEHFIPLLHKFRVHNYIDILETIDAIELLDLTFGNVSFEKLMNEFKEQLEKTKDNYKELIVKIKNNLEEEFLL